MWPERPALMGMKWKAAAVAIGDRTSEVVNELDDGGIGGFNPDLGGRSALPGGDVADVAEQEQRHST
jgi:hypothetical protein